MTIRVGKWDSKSNGVLCAILHSKDTYNGDVFNVVGGRILGEYDYAPIVHTRGEQINYNVLLLNENNQGYSLIISPDNDFLINGTSTSITSPYATQNPGSSRNIKVHNRLLGSGQQVGDGVVYLRSDGWKSTFLNADLRSVGEPHIILDTRNGPVENYSFVNTTFRVWDDVDPDATAPAFRTTSSNHIANRLRIEDCWFKPSHLDSTATDYFIDNNGGGNIRNLIIRDNDFKSNDGIRMNGGTLAGHSRVEGVDFADRFTVESLEIDDSTLNGGVVVNDSLVGTGKRDDVLVDGGIVGNAILAGADGAEVRNVSCQTTAGAGNDYSGVHCNGYNNCRVVNVHVIESDDQGIRLRGNNNYAEGVVIDTTNIDGLDVTLSNSTDAIVIGQFENIFWDDHIRCVVNGRSRQDATPGSGATEDDWGGNEGQAEALGVVVEDASVAAPYDLYKVDSGGNWIQIG